MRLPMTPNVSTKDGTSNKNARLTNCLKETTKRGDMAVIRPGLVLSDTFTGVGSGLIPFDGRLLQIWNDTVYDPNDYGTWPLDAPEWDASTTYDWNDAVWYDGDLWFSTAGSNMGHAPGGGYWSRSPDDTDYESGTTYNVGDSVTMGGVVYYAVISGSGHTPSESSDYWSVTAPGTSRYQVSSVSFNGTSLGSGPISSYRDGAAIGAYSLVPYLECTAPHYTGFWAVGIAPINNVGATWYANAYVKLGCAPQAPGIFSIGSIDAV
jgi:hypothetical protein